MTEGGILRHALAITTSKEKCLISNMNHLVLFRMLQTYIVSRLHYIYKESLNRTTKLAANSTDGNVIQECSIYDSSSLSRASQTGRRE